MIDLSPEEKARLERQHRTERDGRVRDRIKAVLLHAEAWGLTQISQALRIHEETVRTHLHDYAHSQKLKPENGGSSSFLNQEHSKALSEHLETTVYVKTSQICAYVKERFQIAYTVPGMTKWLHRHEFSYKQPKGTPFKADPKKQAEFIESYQLLMKTTPEDEPIEFGDGVHPTMATKVAYGWIRKGVDKLVSTTASRTRINLMGSLNLETMSVTIDAYETIDSATMGKHFEALKAKYPKAPKIHLILDRGPYNTSRETRDAASKQGIMLHYLPPYSPNLNPIERLWKVMNEHVRNNVFFKTASEFKQSIMNFFNNTWPRIANSRVERINDNFQTLNPAPSG